MEFSVFALGFGDIATTAKVGFDKAEVDDLLVGGVYERLDFRNCGEVILQKLLRGGAVNLEAVGETEGFHTKN